MPRSQTLTLCSVLQFLKRNPSQRIGGGPGDAADVQVGLEPPQGGAVGQKVTEGAKGGELLACLGVLYPQRHPFFRHINWDDLLARRVDPPFRPCLVSGGSIGTLAGGGPLSWTPLDPSPLGSAHSSQRRT